MHRPTWILASAALVATLGLAGCDIDKEEEGQLPDVDVSVEEGQLPDYDVEGPDVDVGTEQRTITVPDIDVELPDEDDPDINEQPAPTTPPAGTTEQR